MGKLFLRDSALDCDSPVRTRHSCAIPHEPDTQMCHPSLVGPLPPPTALSQVQFPSHFDRYVDGTTSPRSERMVRSTIQRKTLLRPYQKEKQNTHPAGTWIRL